MYLIQSYAGGTHPWNKSWPEQNISDGLLEVVSIDNRDMAKLKAGGRGKNICQCRNAVIITKNPVPMQVSILSIHRTIIYFCQTNTSFQQNLK